VGGVRQAEQQHKQMVTGTLASCKYTHNFSLVYIYGGEKRKYIKLNSCGSKKGQPEKKYKP
jgi:hypothetical protein